MNKENRIILIITIIILVFASLFISDIISERYSEQTLAEYCKSIENDPSLSYNCECYPYTDTEHIETSIQDKVDNMCVCKCIIGDNKTMTIPIARVKD